MQNLEEELFELLQPLGTGGFAVTYKARVLDPELVHDFGTDIVALKIPHDKKKERALKGEVEKLISLQRGMRERETVNLVRYLGFEVFQGKIIMVMEYAAQGSLRGKIGDIGYQRRLPIEEAVEITLGVLNGLSVLHREHIFHRDIKPENILMQAHNPKITDFGISRMLAAAQFASTTTGTLPYMSPELLSNKGASFASDIWSLGVMCYEMLAGQLPFGEPGVPIVLMIERIRHADMVPLDKLRPEVPPELCRIVRGALQADPQDRFATGQEMYAALQAFTREQDKRIEHEAHEILGWLNQGGESTIAEARFRNLVDKYPRDSRAYRYLGEYYNRCQRHAEAIESFQQGLELEPHNASLYWDVALGYQRIGRQEAAVESLRRAIALGLEPRLRQHAATLLRALEIVRR
jgi:serine/threonine protein kinase